MGRLSVFRDHDQLHVVMTSSSQALILRLVSRTELSPGPCSSIVPCTDLDTRVRTLNLAPSRTITA